MSDIIEEKMEKVITYEFNGRQATVIVPEKPNGKWIWKTEFLYAFDQAEVELLKMEFPKPEANIPWEVAVDAVSSYLHRNPKSIDGIGNFYEYVSTWNYDGAVRNFEAKKRAREKDKESKVSNKYTQEQLNSLFSNIDEVEI